MPNSFLFSTGISSTTDVSLISRCAFDIFDSESKVNTFQMCTLRKYHLDGGVSRDGMIYYIYNSRITVRFERLINSGDIYFLRIARAIPIPEDLLLPFPRDQLPNRMRVFFFPNPVESSLPVREDRHAKIRGKRGEVGKERTKQEEEWNSWLSLKSGFGRKIFPTRLHPDQADCLVCIRFFFPFGYS